MLQALNEVFNKCSVQTMCLVQNSHPGMYLPWEAYCGNNSHGVQVSSTSWWLTFVFKCSYHFIFREGNGTPLQYSCLENPMEGGAWWAAVHGVAKIQTQLRDFTFTFHFHALEKAMETHSSVLAWRIPGTGEPGGLPSMASHRVRHNWSEPFLPNLLFIYFFKATQRGTCEIKNWKL